jgi:hypothetical protein
MEDQVRRRGTEMVAHGIVEVLTIDECAARSMLEDKTYALSELFDSDIEIRIAFQKIGGVIDVGSRMQDAERASPKVRVCSVGATLRQCIDLLLGEKGEPLVTRLHFYAGNRR